MAGYDFPNTPNIGDQYTPSMGPTYEWDGTIWVIVPAGAGGLANWEENGTTFQPKVAGYDLGAVGNEVGSIFLLNDQQISWADGAFLRYRGAINFDMDLYSPYNLEISVSTDFQVKHTNPNNSVPFRVERNAVLSPNASNLGSSTYPWGDIYQATATRHYFGNSQEASISVSAGGNLNLKVNLANDVYIGGDSALGTGTAGGRVLFQVGDAAGTGIITSWIFDHDPGALYPSTSGIDIGILTNLVGNIYQATDKKHYFGDSQEGEIFYSSTGYLVLDNAGNINGIEFRKGGETQWVIDPNGDFRPPSALLGKRNFGTATIPIGNIYFANERRCRFADSTGDENALTVGCYGVPRLQYSNHTELQVYLERVGTVWTFSSSGHLLPRDSLQQLGATTNKLTGVYSNNFYLTTGGSTAVGFRAYMSGSVANLYALSGTTLGLGTGGSRRINLLDDSFYPNNDDAIKLGLSNKRWTNVYSVATFSFNIQVDNELLLAPGAKLKFGASSKPAEFRDVTPSALMLRGEDTYDRVIPLGTDFGGDVFYEMTNNNWFGLDTSNPIFKVGTDRTVSMWLVDIDNLGNHLECKFKAVDVSGPAPQRKIIVEVNGIDYDLRLR